MYEQINRHQYLDLVGTTLSENTMTEILALIAAVLCQLMAMVCFYWIWTKKTNLVVVFSGLAVVIWLLSFGFWMAFLGAEFGIILGFLFVPIVAWCLVCWARTPAAATPPKFKLRDESDTVITDKKQTLITLLRLFNGIVLAGMVCLLGLSWLVLALPMNEGGRLITALILLPIIWGGILAYTFSSTKQWRLLMLLSTVVGIVGLRILL